MGVPQIAKDWGTAGIGAVMVATVAFGGVANAQDNNVQLAAVAPEGAPVTFQYGPGVNKELIESAMRVVSGKGCPVTATSDGRPKRVKVSTNGANYSFKDPGDAAGWALENCKATKGD